LDRDEGGLESVSGTLKRVGRIKVALSAAAKRDDRCIVVPSGLKGGAVKIAAKFIAAGLVK
jgi:hypothetical protein